MPLRPGASFTYLAPPLKPGAAPPPVDIIAIGVSTGGPNALSALLPELPGDLPVPIVIVQHMPPFFTRLLADRLGAQSALAVCEGAAGQTLQPGTVYIAPGDYHMTVRRDGKVRRIHTNQDSPENSCRPAADVLFRSVVGAYGSGTLGVVLTGMGQDGLRGCEMIREAGGRVLAQDEASSVVWGMPGFVARAGLADKVLPLNEIAAEIVRRVTRDRVESRVRGITLA
jgi:two-component system chemotaxis response regulator CheB